MAEKFFITPHFSEHGLEADATTVTGIAEQSVNIETDIKLQRAAAIGG